MAIRDLQRVFSGPNQTTTDPDALRTYGSSENSYHPTAAHAIIVRDPVLWEYLLRYIYVLQVRPSSTEDVVHIVNIARKYRVPIVAYSGATSLEGHFSGVRCSRRFKLYLILTRGFLVLDWKYMFGYVRNGQNLTDQRSAPLQPVIIIFKIFG